MPFDSFAEGQENSWNYGAGFMRKVLYIHVHKVLVHVFIYAGLESMESGLIYACGEWNNKESI